MILGAAFIGALGTVVKETSGFIASVVISIVSTAIGLSIFFTISFTTITLPFFQHNGTVCQIIDSQVVPISCWRDTFRFSKKII